MSKINIGVVVAGMILGLYIGYQLSERSDKNKKAE